MGKKRTVINIISGKGGTGKTLLTAVVAEMLGNEGASVLVVDLDMFVRGLTALLYFHKGETIKITENDDLPVSAFFRKKDGTENNTTKEKISISRYRSFDVCPSVSSINELLDFHDMMLYSAEEATKILNNLLKSIPDKYDFVFFDCRAGYDDLIAAAHSTSDLSICVEEDDNISMVTTDNLIEQLKKYGKNYRGCP
jgi:septum site-determining protein MinD